eukprot:scaffold48595_cov68-Phaeocystis_antarctica.AAC.2
MPPNAMSTSFHESSRFMCRARSSHARSFCRKTEPTLFLTRKKLPTCWSMASYTSCSSDLSWNTTPTCVPASTQGLKPQPSVKGTGEGV